MRTLLLVLALLLPLVAAVPSAAADVDPWPLCPLGSPDYCIDVDDGEVCTTVHLGDLEGPYTHCESVPGVERGQLPGECTGTGDHYCYKVENGRVCLTYDLGDLEGPYTTCVRVVAAAAAGPVCTTDLFQAVGACVGSGCVTVYVGPSATPVCVDVAPLPRVCTIDLFQAVGVCVEDGCTTVWVGLHAERVCLRAQ